VAAESHISIWFFVGVLLTLYGVIITGAGIYGLFIPPPVALAEYHADLWWGLILSCAGLYYTTRFAPRRLV